MMAEVPCGFSLSPELTALRNSFGKICFQFLKSLSVMKGGELGEDMLEVRFALEFRVFFTKYSESTDEGVGTSQVSRIHTPKTR